MKIAITFDNSISLFQNGVQQNAIYLARILQNAGHKTFLIVNDFYKGKDVNYIKSMTPGIDKAPMQKIYAAGIDVLITVGMSISHDDIKMLKVSNPNVKIIAYKCGNEMLSEMESIIFAEEISSASKINPITPDAIWSIPQMVDTNLTYYALKYNQNNVTVVPFIWDHVLSDVYMQENNIPAWDGRDIKRIATMEPNLSVMKNAFVPMAIVSKCIKDGIEIDAFHTFSTDKIAKKQPFLKKVSDFSLNKIKFTANSRYPTFFVMKNHADLCLSWQWENNLNYLWLDVAWMGWPVVHNGSLCQDVGYYYPEFDIESGQIQVQKAIKSHNDDNDYLERNRSIIKRYTHKNEQLKADYKMLLDNLVNDKFVEYNYDWKTNSLK